MKRQTFFTFVFILAYSINCFAMDKVQFDAQYSNINSNKLEEVYKFLNEKELELQHDPDYYVILLNYVMRKGNLSGVTVAKGTAQGDDLVLRDQKTGEEVGFLGFREGFDENIILNGIDKTIKATSNFKNRLDIRFGIIEAARKIKKWELIGSELENIINESINNDNQWVWGPIGKIDGHPKEFMLENVQWAISELFRIDNQIADVSLIKASQALIKCYPKVIYGYSNLGVYYLAKKDFENATEYLNSALAINPNDEIVKGNIEILNKIKTKKE